MKKTKIPQFGVTSMGEKGQVVIPADIRTGLNLTKGEKLIVIADERGVMLMPAAHFKKFAKYFAAMEQLVKSVR